MIDQPPGLSSSLSEELPFPLAGDGLLISVLSMISSMLASSEQALNTSAKKSKNAVEYLLKCFHDLVIFVKIHQIYWF